MTEVQVTTPSATPAPVTPGAEGSSSAASDAVATPSGEAVVNDTSLLGGLDADKGEAGTPDAKPEAKVDDVAPESYVGFTVPEGVTIDSEALDKFKGVAKELNLSQDKAQKLIDIQSEIAKKSIEAQTANWNKIQEDWKAETKKELGNEFETKMSLAAKTMGKFGTPELKKMMDDTGLGNHKDIIKFFVKVGESISEDNFVSGTPVVAEKTTAQKLYGDNKQ